MLLEPSGLVVNGRERHEYPIHAKFRLPDLWRLDDYRSSKAEKSEIKRKVGDEVEIHKLYRVHWPGEIQSLGKRHLDHTTWPIDLPWIGGWNERDTEETMTIVEWANSKLNCKPDLDPTHWPAWLAYHVAVNWTHYSKTIGKKVPSVPIGAIPHDVVQAVFNVHIAIRECSSYLQTIEHLGWLADAFRRDPLLSDGSYDTVVRDRLYGLVIEAVQEYFYMIGDCICDESGKFARSDLKYQWDVLAGYIWWTGRTGLGLVPEHAGLHFSSGMDGPIGIHPDPWGALLKIDPKHPVRRSHVHRAIIDGHNKVVEYFHERSVRDADGRIPKKRISKSLRKFAIENPR